MSIKPLILIVDDEDLLRISLTDYLEDSGYVVYGADSGESGLQQLLMLPVDLCLVDMRLPGMNGNEFIQRARAFKKDLKIIIFTGSVDYTLPEELRRLGLRRSNILFKPLTDLSLLVKMIEATV